MKRLSNLIVILGILSMGLTACSKDNSKQNNDTAVQTSSSSKAASSGHFITLDSNTIYGDKITSDIYKENDLTLVNIMATWCGPCVRELPELQQINEEDNGFGVVGVVIDAFDEITGETVDAAVKEAKNIAEKTGAKYPLTIPTRTFLQQTMKNSAALLPMSFIVNNEGKIVKGPIAGARTKEQWLDILNSVRDALN